MTLVRGRDRAEPLSLRADAVVVGSGAGGAVVARELARAGLSVVVVEEGGHYAPSEYARFSPARSIGTLMREAGLAVAMSLSETPVMSVLAGRCVGGSSVLTGGVCFRIPEAVRAEWEHDHGLRGVTAAALAPLYEALEADLGVETVPEAMRSRSTELFVEGAERLGVPMKSLRRNTDGCKGAARCNFGCPNGAKKSVDVVMLPEVLARSGTLLSDALVERVIVEGGIARGVRGRFLRAADGEPDVPFEIRAERVVVACGALHTPMLLSRSGVRSPHLGRNMTLHPSFRVGALFDEDVQGWDGAMQSVYSDHFQDDGITLVGAYTAPSVLAAAFPGVGRAHRRLTAALPRLAFFGAMIHDEAAGRVRSFFGREPLITYAMTPRDRERMWRGIGILAELAFAAGAREVLLPIFGQDPVASSAELAQLLRARPSARRVEAMSFHPLGTARMGADAAHGVVRESGETFQVENLFVADGSVLPTSLGVNSQLPIMTIALKIGRGIAQGAAAALREAHAQPPTARTTSATWANTNPLARHTSA